MPLSSESCGIVPRQSPINIHAILPWTMNFAAGVKDCSPALFENRNGETPIIHPIFLPATSELIGAFASIYAAGYTKQEMTRNTFVHHTCDFELFRPIQSNESISTNVQLVSLKQSKSGVKTLTRLNHLDTNGTLVAQGYFGGVLLGYQQADLSFVNTIDVVPERPIQSQHSTWMKHCIKMEAYSAHVYDACIRDPRNSKSKSSDINVHTNFHYSSKAGLPSRTLNGLCILGVVCSKLMEHIHCDMKNVQRVGCTFSSPVYLAFESVELTMYWQKHNNVLNFYICDEKENKVLRDGYIVLTVPIAAL